MQFLDANFVHYSPTRWLSFDDVLLLPMASEFNSRNDPRLSLNTYITSKFSRPTPIISANMDTVTGGEMAVAMHRLGGTGILHRFYDTFQEFMTDCSLVAKECGYIAFSIGCNKDDLNIVEEVLKLGVTTIVCVDVAHGHMKQALEQVLRLSATYGPKIQIIAGNVATPEGVYALAAAGADAIKVGVGSGAACSTRIVTGHGTPQLTAIMHARRAINNMKKNVTIIADGGIRNSGDIIKALAAGADSVMVGRLFAGCYESAGKNRPENGGLGYKPYRGQSSRDFLNDIGKGSEVAAEGVSSWVKCTGPLEKTFKELTAGIRSGLTYSGAKNFDELFKKANFIEITTAGLIESHPHMLGAGTFEQIT